MLYLRDVGLHTTSEAIFETHSRFLNENDLVERFYGTYCLHRVLLLYSIKEVDN